MRIFGDLLLAVSLKMLSLHKQPVSIHYNTLHSTYNQRLAFGIQLKTEGPFLLPIPTPGSDNIRCRCLPAGSLAGSIARATEDEQQWPEAADSLAHSNLPEPPTFSAAAALLSTNTLPALSPSNAQDTSANLPEPPLFPTAPILPSTNALPALSLLPSNAQDTTANLPEPTVFSNAPALLSANASPALSPLPSNAQDAFSEQPVLPCDGFGGALISLGPQTDAVLDRFNLDDTLLPRLRVLTTTVRSSKWEATLRRSQWGLSYEQAVNLSKAMLADIKNQSLPQLQVPNCTILTLDSLLTSSHSVPKAFCHLYFNFSSIPVLCS